MRVIPRDQISMVLQAPTIIAGGFPRNHQNGRTYGTTTYTAREIISVFSTGSEVTSFVFCSVHKGKTWGVLGSEVRVGGKTHKFGSCSCVVKPWLTGKTCMIHVKVNTNTTFQRTFSEKKKSNSQRSTWIHQFCIISRTLFSSPSNECSTSCR